MTREAVHISVVRILISLGLVIAVGALTLIWLGREVGSIYAQSCGTGSTKADGLVSAFNIDSNFGSGAGCVTGSLSYIPLNQARIVISDYQSLYNKYYVRNADPTIPKITQSGIISNPMSGLGPSNSLVYSNGDLTLRNTALSDASSAKVVVFFVNGKLNIQTDITEAKLNQLGGVVFIVKGDVNIGVNVSEVNAVVISGGTICSACDENGTDTSNNIAPFTDPQLKMYGSFVALDSTKPIRFLREYNTNVEPAELINAQAKYLVILKNIFGERIKLYQEI